MSSPSFFPKLGMGVGLRTPHYAHILETRPKVSWFEATSENYMGIEGGSGGRPRKVLHSIREHYPVVLHGVSLSIGSCDPVDPRYLALLKELVRTTEPAWVSDHLCWTGVDGKNVHDLLPLPYTEEAIDRVVEKVDRVQDALGRQILLENVSSYVTFAHSEMTEWDFLSEVALRADCGILLDINNIYVSSVNHGFDPLLYLEAIPPARVGQFHLAGHQNLGTHLIDTHDHPVCAAVWALYRQAIRRFGPVSTLLEWDDHIPAFAVLEKELARAQAIQEELLGNETSRAHPARPAEVDAMDHHRP